MFDTKKEIKLVYRTIQKHLISSPNLKPAYEAVQQIIHIFAKPAFYEISNKCNLKCEGCYYFDSSVFKPEPLEKKIFSNHWENLLSSESIRGVTMPYFLGAEPALEEKRLITAAKYFKRGNIGTNGTVFLTSEIPFRISISAWAGDETDDMLYRGGKALHKALQLYKNDPRAIVLYTLNRYNINQTKDIVKLSRDNGLPITFNLWSPTKNLFSNSDKSINLSFRNEDLKKVRETLDEMIESFPDTVIYSHKYNEWSTTPGPLYTLNSQGIAENCASRLKGNFSYYGLDLEKKDYKCCTSSIECKECRLYSGGWSSHFSPKIEQIKDIKDFSQWIDMILTIGRIFLRKEIDSNAFINNKKDTNL